MAVTAASPSRRTTRVGPALFLATRDRATQALFRDEDNAAPGTALKAFLEALVRQSARNFFGQFVQFIPSEVAHRSEIEPVLRPVAEVVPWFASERHPHAWRPIAARQQVDQKLAMLIDDRLRPPIDVVQATAQSVKPSAVRSTTGGATSTLRPE